MRALQWRHNFLSSQHRFSATLDVSAVVSESEVQVESRDDDSSVTTILSSLSSDDEDDDHDEDDSRCKAKKYATLGTKWLRLQKVFDQRDRMFERLSQNKNPRLIALIREREVVVRKLQRELLLLNHLEEDSQEQHHIDGYEEMDEEQKGNVVENEHTEEGAFEYDKDDENSVVWHDCLENADIFPDKVLTAETATKRGILHRMYDITLFEWYIGLPAVLSLIFHDLTHMAIFDLAEIFVELSGGFLHLRSLLSYSLCFLLGLVLMRSSGYLFWWLGDNDFNCIKFDMHNRLRLRYWDACYMMWIKRYSFIRALLFMAGYHVCHKVIFDCYENFFDLFVRPDSVLVPLPEGQFRRDFLLMAKDCIAWASLRVDVNEEMEYPLSGPLQATLFLLFLTASFVMILKFYGFRFFYKF